MNNMDWNELRSFYLVAKHGSHAAAARAEQVSQPTLSRHVSRLEMALGARVFDRSKTGVALTPAGAVLFEQATKMAFAAAHISPSSVEPTTELSGTVRITASSIVATYLLPDLLVNLRSIEPGIEVELVASDQTENLHYREADIAIRMFRPRQPDVITKKLGELQLGIYASQHYLRHRGVPANVDAFMKHDFVGYDRSPLIIDGFRGMGIEVTREFFRFRSDDQVVCWQMVVAGLGVGFNQRIIGDGESGVTRIELPVEMPSIPVWLTAHASLKTDPKIRCVYDFLADAIRGLLRA